MSDPAALTEQVRAQVKLLSAWAQDEPHILQSVRSFEPQYPNPAALRSDVRGILAALDALAESLAETEGKDEVWKRLYDGSVSDRARLREALRAIEGDVVTTWLHCAEIARAALAALAAGREAS